MLRSSCFLDGESLKIDEIVRLVYTDGLIEINPSNVEKIVTCSTQFKKTAKKNKIYGVNTNFGGLATKKISNQNLNLLQNNLIRGLKCGCGEALKDEIVRAAMLLRANALIKGVSGLRLELIERILLFLNHRFTPIVPEFGSIGASGDLVPLSYIAGSIIGLDEHYWVNSPQGKISCKTALKRLNIQPIDLEVKEGLALVNGTSFMTGMAVVNFYNAKRIFNLALIIHSFYLQALNADANQFHPFIHENKPHPGQQYVAEVLFNLLNQSHLFSRKARASGLVQDRYSIRCIPQYLGPIYECFEQVRSQLEIEANSANDNPLLDVKNNKVFHGGNFLGQHVSFGMDQIRHSLGLLIKHLDVQIALLVTPEFSNGLPACLIDNNDGMDFGLKGLQLTANSLMPLIIYNCQPIAHLFPSHAEQYNQNINSQGYNSAKLTSESIDKSYMYLSVSILFAIQAIDLRAYQQKKNDHAASFIPCSLKDFYLTVCELLNASADSFDVPFLKRTTLSLDECIERLTHDLTHYDSKIHATIANILATAERA